MKIYEEFLLRHNANVPVIEHHSEWSFLFRTYGKHWKTPFVLLSVQWANPDASVGYYMMTYNRINHDGYAVNRYFDKYGESRVAWDQYDDYFSMVEFRQNLDQKRASYLLPIYGENDILFAAWEVFVCTHDAWVARQSSEFRGYVEGVIDETRSDNDRIKSYQNALLFLTTKETNILRAWKTEIMGRMKNYGHWLGRLLAYDSNSTPKIDLLPAQNHDIFP